MNEVGETPKEVRSQVEAEFSAEQKLLIGRAMDEVDSVYDENGEIKRGNKKYFEEVRPILHRAFSLPQQSNPRVEGYRQVNNAAESDLAGVRSALFRVEETLEKSYLPQSIKDAIRHELVGIVKDQQNSEAHQEEAKKGFRRILNKTRKDIDNLQGERRRVVQRSGENQENAGRIRRKESSELTETFFRISRNLAGESKNGNARLRKKEDEFQDNNQSRYSKFRSIVDDLVATIKPEEASVELL